MPVGSGWYISRLPFERFDRFVLSACFFAALVTVLRFTRWNMSA